MFGLINWSVLSFAVIFIHISNAVPQTSRIRLDDIFRSHPLLQRLNTQVNPPEDVRRRAQIDERASDACAASALNFALDLGVQLTGQSYASKGEVFSPLSIISSLSLLMLGAKGRSYEELNRVLGLSTDVEFRHNPQKFHEQFGILLEDVQNGSLNGERRLPNWRYTKAKNNIRGNDAQNTQTPEHIVAVVNGLFAQKGYSLNPDYELVIRSVYRSELTVLDFQRYPAQARDYINSWISAKTHDKIPTVIQNIPESTNLIMATAIYFKGFWENSFFEYATNLEDFYPDGLQGKSVKVQMMATGGSFPFYQSSEYDCDIIGLPYMGNLTTMYIIKPNDSSRQKVQAFQQSLTADIIEYMISKMQQTSAVLAFPRMHLRRNIHLRNLLKQMNVKSVFTNSESDLSLIGGETPQRAIPVNSDVQRIQSEHQRSAPLIFIRNSGTDEDEAVHGDTAALEEQNNGKTGEDIQEARSKRQSEPIPIYNRNLHTPINSLDRLEAQRSVPSLVRSNFFVEEIVHAVDINVNEFGTEAAAATLTYLRRSGTNVVFRADTPFLVLLRHDPTKMPLFYGVINEPEL